MQGQLNELVSIDEERKIEQERATSEWTKETERLKKERRSGLRSQAQDHSGETDEWKDEDQSDRAKPPNRKVRSRGS